MVGKQAEVADAMKAGWQDVDEEAADELIGREGHRRIAFASFGAIILPLEGDGVFLIADESPVRDRHPVGVQRKVSQHRFGSRERSFGVDNPVGLPVRHEVLVERVAFTEVCERAIERQLIV